LTKEENAERIKRDVDEKVLGLRKALIKMNGQEDDEYNTPWARGLVEGQMLAYQFVARQFELDEDKREAMLDDEIENMVKSRPV
jgi:DNA-binding transcriptional regulator GbsR (MarR family)